MTLNKTVSGKKTNILQHISEEEFIRLFLETVTGKFFSQISIRFTKWEYYKYYNLRKKLGLEMEKCQKKARLD